MAHYVYSWPGTHIDKPLFGKRPGEWTLPNHNYIGPGNPVDRDDFIALRHDQDYHNAQTDEDVRTADREAIAAFWDNAKENYNWHSLVGTLGLGIKYGVESATGVIYPHMDMPPATPAKRKLDVDPQEAGPSKVAAMTDPLVGAEQKTNTSAGSDEGMGTGTSIAMNPLVDKSIKNSNRGTYIFKHKRIFSSYASSFGYKSTWVPKTGETQSFLITPFCNVPVEAIPWWMSPQEFANLPVNSEIKKVRCVIKPYGYRMPFLVKSSGLTYANSQADIIGCYATGLNNKYNGYNFQLTYDDSNVMKPKDISIDKGYNTDALWGQVTGTDKALAASSFIPMCQGNITPLNTYFCQNIDVSTNNGYATYLFDDLNTFLWKGIGHDIVYEYRPEICMLKPSFMYCPARNGNFVIPAGGKFVDNQESKYSGWMGSITGQDAPTFDAYNTGSTIPYESVIEQAGIVSRGMTNSQGAFMAPTLHVGAMPLDTTHTINAEEFAQPVVLQWLCETECTVSYEYALTHPRLNVVTKEGACFVGDTNYLKCDGYRGYYMGRPVRLLVA